VSETARFEEAARRIVESSCREQGLEVQITDPVVVGKVAAILRVGSAAPAGGDPVRIEAVETPDGGVDRDRVEHGKEDRPLAA